jgi:putative phosphoribosyl transferase
MFANRVEAGKQLAAALGAYSSLKDHLVVGLPRGGLIVAREVALALHLPLDFIAVRKIGMPRFPEVAMGALVGDVVYLTEPQSVADIEVQHVIEQEKREAARREKAYREGREPHLLHGQTVLLVDDGIATGATLHASIIYLKQQHVKTIILAVPVASAASLARLAKEVDQVVCLLAPSIFLGVGQFYLKFSPVSDEEVCSALKSVPPQAS